MKHLLDFILESNMLNIFEVSNNSTKIRNELRKLLQQGWFKQNNEKMSNTDQNEPNEIFRLELGESEEAYNKLKTIFKDSNINDIEISSNSTVVGRPNGGSGTYESFKIKYKDKIFYVANKTNSKSNLKNKDLTPKKLKLSYENNKYVKFNDLTDKLSDGLNKIKNKYPKSGIYELIIGLINTIKNNTPKRNGSFNEKTVDDFFNSTEEGRLTFDLDSNLIANVLPGDINCIEKDFGEILGPLVFFKLFNDVELSYPILSNEQLVDYFINGHKVSAKQLGGGGDPSGSSIIKAINKNKIEIINNPENITDETSDLSKKEKKIMFEEKEIEFINKVLSTYNYSIFKQQRTLINNFVINNEIQKHLGFNISELNNQNDLEKSLDDVLSKCNIKEYFETLYKLLDYIPTKNSSWIPENIDEKYNSINARLKWGILFYPMYKKAIDKIVSIYGNNDKDIISSVIQKVTDMKQVYFGIRKKEGIKLEIVSSAVSKWTFTTGGMSTNNIDNAKLSIKIKHSTK